MCKNAYVKNLPSFDCFTDECSSGEETGPNIFVPPTTQCLKARAPKHSLLCSSPIPGSGSHHHHGSVTYLFTSNLSKINKIK